MKLFHLTLLVFCLLAEPVVAQTFVLVSDLNGRYGSTDYHPRVAAAVEAIIEIQPEAVISAGDMVAGQKKPLLEGPEVELMWQALNRTVTDPLAAAGIPLAVTPGNHDGSGYPEFLLEQEYYLQQWNERTEELEILPGSQWPRRYAARLGDVLLLAFDGTMPGKLPESERKFVETMLDRHASPDRITIALSHLPMWPLAAGREKEILDDPALLDLLHRYGVDVYISGHHHVFNVGADDGGMLHVAVGALGGNVRAFSSGTGAHQSHSFAVLEFTGDVIEVQARVAPDFVDTIDYSELPARVEGPLGVLHTLKPRGQKGSQLDGK